MLPPSHVWDSCKTRLRQFLWAISAALLVFGTTHAAPPGAIIANTATLDYLNDAGVPSQVSSNTVEVTAAVVRSPSSVAFTRVVDAGSFQETVGPAACEQSGAFVDLADPVLLGGNAIDPSNVQNVTPTTAFNLGEVVFIRLVDSDQNLDFMLIEYALVTVAGVNSGDIETIRLTETGADTGVFSGYVPTAGGAATSGDCVLQLASGTTAQVRYSDPADGADTSMADAEIDPTQRVFESLTGNVVSGAEIELVDAVSGLSATVYGNDGVSLFPSLIVSGGTATDSAGTTYVFAAGEYRFPVVPDGDYRLIVRPPAEYAAPSTATESSLQALPGAPFTLSPASFGAAFSKIDGVSIAADIPVDPRSEALFLDKRTTTTIAAPGDFVRYELTIENASSSGIATDVEIVDQLPSGARYVPGSVTIDGAQAADPIISADSATLEFSVATLNTGERLTMFYVVEIIGGESNEEFVNRATAFASGGLVSNEATATIRLREDLFRSTGTIIGRVLEADCSESTFSQEQGVANIRVYLEDGRYAVTDAGGRFHFEGLKPGTHVAQLDTFTVPEYFDVIGCADTPGFAGSADSQFVKLSRGSLQRADFYLRRKPRPEGRIDLELKNIGTDSAEQVEYLLVLNGQGNVAIGNINVKFLLPDGVSYAAGSMRIDGSNLGEPRVSGPVMMLALNDQFGNWTSELRFIADIDNKTSGELETRAVATFDSAIQSQEETPVAITRMIREPAAFENEGYVLDLKFAVLSDQLSGDDMRQLDRLIQSWSGVKDIRIGAVGHSDSQRIAARNVHLFADNYALSKARALAAAAYVADALGVPARDIQVEGRGPDEPVAENTTAAGRQANRRVEMVLSGTRPSKPSFLEVTQASSGTKVVPTQGAVPGENQPRRRLAVVDPNAGMPASQTQPPIDSLSPGIAVLLPEPGFQPAIPATKIAVQHAPGQTVKIYVNEQPINPLTFDALAVNTGQTVAVSRWNGVDLVDGNNVIRVVVSNADGSRARSLRREVYFSGQAIRGEIVAEQSTLVADGKTPPVIAVRLYDRAGRPSRAGTVGAYRIDAPYRSLWDVENERRNELVAIATREPVYRVGADGIAFIELEPTSQSGEVTVNLKFGQLREQQLRGWLKPAARDWILVGFAEGTSAYNSLAQNMDAALAAGLEDGYVDEGRVAFFAKGSIKGEYLLTLAYDSDRDRAETRDRFATVIDPEQYYPLYADTSEQRFEAPSQRKLYVKLERGQFNALFGDFETGLSVTDLARYDRRFNGLKSEYRGEVVGFTAFAAESNQGFHRDELQGDGTSGLYRLGNAGIIANSEQVRIEVRDRFDAGLVVSERKLSRFLDYTLDPLTGTIFFKQPVPSRDLDFNPVFIVIEYETAGTADEDLVAGGRVSLKSAGDAVEVGVTHINDQTAGSEGDLTGVDLRWQIGSQTLIKAEYAGSNATRAGIDQSGSAHSIELEHNGESVDVQAFMREVQDGFGLGQQSAADSGFRRLGVDVRASLGERLHFDAEAGWQQNLATEDIRNLARAQLRYERRQFSASLGLTHAADKFEDGENRTSDLGEIGVAQSLLDGRLTLRASSTEAFSKGVGSTDFPSRFVVGADYKLLQDVDLISEYEQSSGDDIEATMTRLGVRATPWHRGQVNTSVTNSVSEFGPRLFANVGLLQGFQLNERWTLDVGLDQTNTLVDPDARDFDADRERVSGSINEDFLAFFMGALYSKEAWSANSRLEYRNSDSEERNSLLVGWYREPTVGHGLSAGLTLLKSDTVAGAELTSADLKLGWAYRLADSRWSFLNRTDLVFEDATLPTESRSSWRLINNFNANRRFSAATQLSVQYAFKYLRSEFDGDGYTGYTDLVGVDIRRGLRGRFDVGLNTSIYHSYAAGAIDYGAGIDVGVNLRDNLWLTLGYNVTGFHDSDFSEARYTAQGPFLRFSVKANQHMLKRIAGR